MVWCSTKPRPQTKSRFSRETPPLEVLIYLPHDFKNLTETPHFLITHTKIFKMTYN